MLTPAKAGDIKAEVYELVTHAREIPSQSEGGGGAGIKGIERSKSMSALVGIEYEMGRSRPHADVSKRERWPKCRVLSLPCRGGITWKIEGTIDWLRLHRAALQPLIDIATPPPNSALAQSQSGGEPLFLHELIDRTAGEAGARLNL